MLPPPTHRCAFSSRPPSFSPQCTRREPSRAPHLCSLEGPLLEQQRLVAPLRFLLLQLGNMLFDRLLMDTCGIKHLIRLIALTG